MVARHRWGLCRKFPCGGPEADWCTWRPPKANGRGAAGGRARPGDKNAKPTSPKTDVSYGKTTALKRTCHTRNAEHKNQICEMLRRLRMTDGRNPADLSYGKSLSSRWISRNNEVNFARFAQAPEAPSTPHPDPLQRLLPTDQALGMPPQSLADFGAPNSTGETSQGPSGDSPVPVGTSNGDPPARPQGRLSRELAFEDSLGLCFSQAAKPSEIARAKFARD